MANASVNASAVDEHDPVMAGLNGTAAPGVGVGAGVALGAWPSWLANATDEDLFSSTGFPSNDTFEQTSYELPVWRQVLWSVLFAGMVIVAACGNVMVIWIVLAHKRMRTVTNYFLVSLSIADAMVSMLNVTATYVGMLYNNWPFGRLYCKLSQFVAVLSICASVFTLMAISIDRYVGSRALRANSSSRAGEKKTPSDWCFTDGPLCAQQVYLFCQRAYRNSHDRSVMIISVCVCVQIGVLRGSGSPHTREYGGWGGQQVRAGEGHRRPGDGIRSRRCHRCRRGYW
ncbi:hypothetical protein ONE63_006399 [Megalurothrips usitatus]|uniref:G-protein coupled receptors family 1 profile domain-containing protein n=1 Tax=Megalurothrips usitatus TaxID=439358 RepID=A0AAV7Y059_9NEOP|nr:hypothetical protein ONE63_006399 [Megalurothrips usitatus]